MKTNKRSKSLLPAAMIAACVVTSSATYAPPAYSCGWSDPWSCVTGAAGWVWDNTKSAANWVKETGKGIGQFAVRDVWGRLITTFSCPFSTNDAYGTVLACFPDNSMQKTRMVYSLRFLATDTRTDHTYVRVSNGVATTMYFQPSSFSIGRMAYILDGYATEASVYALGGPDQGTDATTTTVQTGMSAPVIVWPSAYTTYPTDGGLAGTLVHEADHTRFGAHTCGDSADQFEDGPYGTEIQYLAKISRTGHPTISIATFEKDFAWDKAAQKLSQICDPDARKRLWNNFLTDNPNTSNPVVAAALTTWQQAVSPNVTNISVLADGTIFGIGTDGIVYQASAGSGWVQSTPSPPSLRDVLVQGTGGFGSALPPAPVPQVQRISVTPDGMIYGIGMDNAVYRSAGRRVQYTSLIARIAPSPWAQVATPWVQRISVTPDGTIYGIGSDNAVWRTTANTGWAQVAPPWVKEISVTPNGAIYGISSDNAVYRTFANWWYWVRVTGGDVQDISVTPTGYIYGLGFDGSVYMRRASDTGWWQKVTEPWVKNISVTPDGVVYGIGGDNAVYVRTTKQ